MIMSENEINHKEQAAFSDLNAIKDMIGFEMDLLDIEANKNPQYFKNPDNVKRWKNIEEAYDRVCDLMDTLAVDENDTCCSDDDECEGTCQ
jgi:hypothetical protein